MLKLQLYLSSFLHLVQTISLQHSHIFVQKEVHRTYLEAQISVHISFKVRGQVFMEIHICGFSSLTSSDGPWQITFSLLKILKFLARLGLEISFSKDWQPYESFQNFRKKKHFTNLQKCFRKRYDHKVRGFYQNVNEFDLRLRFRSYHKERPYVQFKKKIT